MEVKKEVSFAKKFAKIVTGNPIVFLLLIAAVVVGCLKDNPSNEFYKHMGGKLVDNNILTLPNNQ